ncbi:transposase family protein [Streptomyces sp. V4I2]|uniref:transposase family protein n=1 Tax=Streptomyces sp. V4I2 TaxID=3042280 RepID=UPI0035931D6F
MPDPRDPRGVRHRLAVVLVLTACAVLASDLAARGRRMDRRCPWACPGMRLLVQGPDRLVTVDEVLPAARCRRPPRIREPGRHAPWHERPVLAHPFGR